MATKTPTLIDVFERNKYNLDDVAKKSRTWFQQQVLLLNRQRLTPNKVLNSNEEQLRSRVSPGFMYMFAYDPKYKDTLPYYDRFPLVLPYNTFKGGYIGLNLHYLPHQLRIRLLDNLMSFANNTKMDETTKLRYSWQLIDGASRYKLAQPCIKQYLVEHVRSPFRKIDSNDWATAMMLPVERFVGASNEQVWADSKDWHDNDKINRIYITDKTKWIIKNQSLQRYNEPTNVFDDGTKCIRSKFPRYTSASNVLRSNSTSWT